MKFEVFTEKTSKAELWNEKAIEHDTTKEFHEANEYLLLEVDDIRM